MDTCMVSTQEALQDALEDLSSPRSTSRSQINALRSLEHILARAYVTQTGDPTPSALLDAFIALQHTFECNIACRLLPWINLAITKHKAITSKTPGASYSSSHDDLAELGTQLALATSLLQAVALNHEASKLYLGRKHAMETLLDLLLESRHTPVPATSASASMTSTPPIIQPLSSTILDTLLCILVDSPFALRAFEAANGLAIVVKILKRAGTPRDVRMKCLEFLYFYLLDETSPASAVSYSSESLSRIDSTPPRTDVSAPNSYRRHARPRSLRSSSSFSSSSSSSSSLPTTPESTIPSSSMSTPPLAIASPSRSSPRQGVAVPATPKVTPASKKLGLGLGHARSSSLTTSGASSNRTSRSSTRLVTPEDQVLKSINQGPRWAEKEKHPSVANMNPKLLMLRRPVDYTPMSPQKPLDGGSNGPRRKWAPIESRLHVNGAMAGKYREKPAAGVIDELVGSRAKEAKENVPSRKNPTTVEVFGDRRTTEEKKQLLGGLLGNVDALVEGVRKAGVWGLG